DIADLRPRSGRPGRAETHQRRIERQGGERLAGEADRLLGHRGHDDHAGGECAKHGPHDVRRDVADLVLLHSGRPYRPPAAAVWKAPEAEHVLTEERVDTRTGLRRRLRSACGGEADHTMAHDTR